MSADVADADSTAAPVPGAHDGDGDGDGDDHGGHGDHGDHDGDEPTGARPAAPAAAGAAATDLPAEDLRRLRRAWAAGAAPVVGVFTWLIMAGAWAPLQRQYFDDFFDAQARAFLDGRWDVPPEIVSFEGFEIDGRTHIYFGPWPALLRIPVLLVTDRLDGRLTTLSMILAMVVLAVGAHQLNLGVRRLVRGYRPVSRREAVLTAGLAVAALSGPPLWLASAATVHHEAILWGVAFTVAAMAAVLRWVAAPTMGRLAVATALAVGAVSSRVTLGLGVVAGLAMIGALAALRRHLARRRAGADDADDADDTGRSDDAGDTLDGFPLRWVVAACAITVVLSAIPNLARFGTPFGIPMDRQVGSSIFEHRIEFLEANDGAFFGPQFVPTTLVTYLRPDAIEARATFPWVDFPREGPTVVGDTVFDDLLWTSSVPATMPALVVLGVPGVVWAARALRRGGPGMWVAPVICGAAAGAGGALTIGHIANRYLNDWAPLALVVGFAGAHALAGWLPARSRHWRRAATAGVGVLVVAGAWVGLGLGLVHQRERAPAVPQDWRAELFRWRADLPGGRPAVVRRSPDAAPRLPDAGDGTTAVVGDCLGLYVRVGADWFGVRRGPGVGVYDLRVDLDALDGLDEGDRAPLVAFEEDDGRVAVVGITRLDDDRVRVDVAGPAGWEEGYPASLDGEETLRVSLDPRAQEMYVSAGRTVLYERAIADPQAEPTVGAVPDGVDRGDLTGLRDTYPGEVELLPYDDDLCRDVTATG